MSVRSTVLLATGVVNNRPDGIDEPLPCRDAEPRADPPLPRRDGYEVTDKRVAVIGTGDHGTCRPSSSAATPRSHLIRSPHDSRPVPTVHPRTR